jgi:hypothetical protein
MTDPLTLESFTPYLDTEFVARVGEVEDRLKLVEATLLRHQHPEAARPGFALLFNGTRGDLMFNGLTEFEHPEMGMTAIGVSPIGRSADGGIRYEAIFN